jgi:hypothetical protein
MMAQTILVCVERGGTTDFLSVSLPTVVAARRQGAASCVLCSLLAVWWSEQGALVSWADC